MINSIKQKLEQINLIDTTDHKKAGVMIILLQNDNDSGIKILFTKRSSSLSTHSGEVSFPGGKWEEGDKDLYETALRESNEEINLDTKNLKKLGALNYLISRHKIEVHPYVGHLVKNQDFHLLLASHIYPSGLKLHFFLHVLMNLFYLDYKALSFLTSQQASRIQQ